MLSAIESFSGPFGGPSAPAVSPYSQHQYRAFSIAAPTVIGQVGAGFGVTPTLVPQVPYASAHMNALQHRHLELFKESKPAQLSSKRRYGFPFAPPPTTTTAESSSPPQTTSASSPPSPFTMSINERPHAHAHTHTHTHNHKRQRLESAIPPPSAIIRTKCHRPKIFSDGGNGDQSAPINLVTSNAADATNTSGASLHCVQLATDENQSSSSSSVDVDVESERRSMSPVHIPVQSRKSTESTPNPMLQRVSHDPAAVAAAAAAAAYQYNYNLYTRAVFYGAPVIFPSHHPAIAANGDMISPAYLAGGGLSSAQASARNNYAADYLKSMQSVGFSPSGACMTTNNIRNATGSILSFAPMAAPTTSSATHVDADDPSTDAVPSSFSLLSSGTYLNVNENNRVNASPADTDHFKIPNGKDGSLKHRILARPPTQLEKIDTGRVAEMRSQNSSSNFRKGSYIELYNGALRRVEDMRTEDFIQCAERSAQHQLAESTVVKINSNGTQSMVITFTYDRNRLKADMEVSVEHPFFVYGQGWASCNPELSLKVYGLRCQRLQVGDICISLIQKERPTNGLPSSTAPESRQSDEKPAGTGCVAPTHVTTPSQLGLHHTHQLQHNHLLQHQQFVRIAAQYHPIVQHSLSITPPHCSDALSDSGGGDGSTDDQSTLNSTSRKRRWSAPESICNDDKVCDEVGSPSHPTHN